MADYEDVTIPDKEEMENEDFDIDLELEELENEVEESLENETSEDEEDQSSEENISDEDEEEAETSDEEEAKDKDEEKEEKPQFKKKRKSRAQDRIQQLVAEKKELERKYQEANEKLSSAEKRSQEFQKETYNTRIKDLEESLTNAKRNYARALDSGTGEEASDALEKLNDAQLELKILRANAHRLNPKEEESGTEKVQTSQENPRNAEAVQQRQQKVQKWIQETPFFNQDKDFTTQALQLEQSLIQEGFDPTKDYFYDELDDRLAQSFPNLYNKSEDEDSSEVDVKNSQKTTKKAQVAGGVSHTASNKKAKKSFKLTPEQKQVIDELGLTPKEYLEGLRQEEKREKTGSEYTDIIVQYKN